MRILACLLLLIGGSVNAAVDQQLVNFSKMPLVESPQISPDGQKIAAILNMEKGPLVVVMPFGTSDYQPLAQLDKSRDRVDGVIWSGNKYVIVETSYPEYARGQHFRVSRLYSIDLTNNEVKEISGKRFKKTSGYRYQSYVLKNALKHDENHILVSTYDESDEAYTLFKVDLRNNAFDKSFVNKYELNSFSVDDNAVVRVGVSTEKKSDKFERTIWYRKSADEDMTKLHTMIVGHDETFSLVAMNGLATKAYVISDRETGRQSLWSYDIESGEFDKLLFSHDIYDIKGTLKNAQQEVIGVYYNDDFQRHFYFDDKDAELEKSVAAVLKGVESYVVSRSANKQRVLAVGLSDTKVPTYYYFDFAANKASAWLSQFPQLAKTPMQPVEGYVFTASDGKEISGYLTMPAGVEKPPVVVYPHGGPQARDHKYFDPILQFMVSKGYAVLQVNFRGSEGFGNEYEVAGYKQWGKRMQQDVYDAMDWLLASGRVSNDKACVVGFSYGGYVALTSAFQQPNRFDCIVSVSGISDLEEMTKDESRAEFFIENIVDPTDKQAIADLAKVSAINYIDAIKAPVLLIHGTKDTQVGHSQSADFYSKAKGKIDVKYVELKDATHYWDETSSRMALFAELDQFLSKHL